MSDYQPIDCGIHDQLELVCIDHYHIRLTLKDGTSVEGRANTWFTDKSKAEFLKLDWLKPDANGNGTDVRLDQIRTLQVMTTQARIRTIDF